MTHIRYKHLSIARGIFFNLTPPSGPVWGELSPSSTFMHIMHKVSLGSQHSDNSTYTINRLLSSPSNIHKTSSSSDITCSVTLLLVSQLMEFLKDFYHYWGQKERDVFFRCTKLKGTWRLPTEGVSEQLSRCEGSRRNMMSLRRRCLDDFLTVWG